MTEKTLVLSSESETAHLAQQLAKQIRQLFTKDPLASLRISLIGDLGAGKTTFTRYLLQSLGHNGKVKSPTYALCEPYLLNINEKIQAAIHHFDLYRMNYPEEWMDAGFRDNFSNTGVCIVEWAEKAGSTLPAFDLSIEFNMNDDETRTAQLMSLSLNGLTILQGEFQ
jgi:tRNA threonylcarbamoyladenosine biosynthesis protein TsaE